MGAASRLSAIGEHFARLEGGTSHLLDVFHKSCARARDEDGWMHIDLAGRPMYRRRFAAVEPFYNGQARVERFDGGLEVIDETGVRVVELRSALRSEFAALSDDLAGFWRTRAICTAVELGVFEELPATAAGIARSCGLEPARAQRLLRALAELRLVVGEDGTWSGHANHARPETRELRLVTDEDGTWRATERGACLTAGHPRTLADAAIEFGRAFPQMWEALPRALQLDSDWRAPDVFAEVAADPARVTAHHRMLASYALHDYAAVPVALDLRGDERVIDAGGGLGVLAGLLVDACPGLRVTDWRIPPSMTRYLAEAPVDAPVAVLLRHSVRGPLPRGDAGNAVPLTLRPSGTESSSSSARTVSALRSSSSVSSRPSARRQVITCATSASERPSMCSPARMRRASRLKVSGAPEAASSTTTPTGQVSTSARRSSSAKPETVNSRGAPLASAAAMTP